MSEIETNPSPQTATATARSRYGIAGIIIGFIALGLAIVPDAASRIRPEKPKELSEVLVDAGSKLIDTIKSKAIGQKPQQQDKGMSWEVILRTSTMVLGIAAVFLGSISWIKRENRRISGTAVGVAVVAIAWQYIIAAIVIGIVIAVVLIFLSNVGI